MTSFWWLQRGWCETECKDCGANIKASGGDPDWGRCSGCFDRHVAGKEAERMHEAKMVEQHAAQIRSMHEAVLIGEMRGRVQAAFDDVARAKQQADAGFTADMTVEFGHSHCQQVRHALHHGRRPPVWEHDPPTLEELAEVDDIGGTDWEGAAECPACGGWRWTRQPSPRVGMVPGRCGRCWGMGWVARGAGEEITCAL